MKNRLRELRKALGLTLNDVASAAGTSNQQLGMLERGERRLTIEWMQKLAPVLGVEPKDLLPDAGQPRFIPVVGYVGAGAQIFSIDDHEKGGGLEEVEAPIPGLPQSTVAVQVRGRSMEPAFYPGDLIFYDRQDSGDFTHLSGKECIVRLNDGRTFVKIMRRLPDGGWYLHSNNDDPILGIGIEWAAKVKLIVRA
jgi:repressor LexA